MAFTRIKKEEVAQVQQGALETSATKIEAKYTLDAVACDQSLIRKANPYDFKRKYEDKGIRFEDLYKGEPETLKRATIIDGFARGEEIGFAAQLAESLPMYANTPGRLGDYVDVKVTKTARQDDQGGAFVDLVVEIKNRWLSDPCAPKQLQDTVPKITLLLDMTTAGNSEFFEKKIIALRDHFLVRGKEARVYCYENEFGELGVEKPKIIVGQSTDHVVQVAGSLGKCINQVASDKYTITNPESFNQEYRRYFNDLLDAALDNAQSSIDYMNNLVYDKHRSVLIRKYQVIIDFINAYKKTPTTRQKN